MFTMVGAGITQIRHAEKPMSAVLPSECAHIQHRVEEFDPAANQIILSNGQKVNTFFVFLTPSTDNKVAHHVDISQSKL